MQSIVGTWKLLHATARDASGAARPLPYGGKALGRVTFTADGHDVRCMRRTEGAAARRQPGVIAGDRGAAAERVRTASASMG
jgi:hypothetical protein